LPEVDNKNLIKFLSTYWFVGILTRPNSQLHYIYIIGKNSRGN